MNTPRLSHALLALVAIASGTAYAQSAANEFVDRNINQQQRIEQGLQSGQLNTREAARLEKQESKVESMEARALRDGNVSQGEARRIDQAQDHLSRNIYQEKHDTQLGNPNSASSQRMQQDVQRSINQQQRIGQGLQSGSLTPREAGRMEHGQARVNRIQGRAGADGHVGRGEQQHIQRAENRQSGRIYNEKHDGQSGWGQSGRNDNPGKHFGQQHQSGGRQHLARR